MKIKNKLLVICGPTATGKTSLAIKLAEKIDGEIVSADSRQAYKFMDIGTGKELPADAKYFQSDIKLSGKRVGYYKISSTKLWGYDLIHPKREFSVSQYKKVADKIIKNVIRRNKFPILVGGTGLYIKAITDGIGTADVPKNRRLRELLEKKTPEELYKTLSTFDPKKAASMNQSDRKNPRRLIRAIEIADFVKNRRIVKKRLPKYDVLLIGLYSNKRKLESRIKKRVEKRWKAGILSEINYLFKQNVTWDDQSMDALGYKQWRGYFDGKQTLKETLNDWQMEEIRYSKRQMTWFKKDKRIVWFDTNREGCKKEIVKTVNKWYKSSRG